MFLNKKAQLQRELKSGNQAKYSTQTKMHLPVSPLPLHIAMICICWKWFHAAQIVTTGTYFKDISTKSNGSSSSLSKETDFTIQEEMFRCSRDNECKNLGRKIGTGKLSDVDEVVSLSQYDQILEKEETGNIGDSLRRSYGAAFSTPDQDNDNWSDRHCAERFRGPWWSNECFNANLNNDHQDKVPYVSTPEAEGASRMSWLSMDGKFGTIKYSEMMIKRRS
eukprot:gene15544-6808_t